MLEDALADLLSFALIPALSHVNTDDVSRPLRTEIQRLCLDLLPQAVALTDAFGFSDWDLDRFVHTLGSSMSRLAESDIYMKRIGRISWECVRDVMAEGADGAAEPCGRCRWL